MNPYQYTPNDDDRFFSTEINWGRVCFIVFFPIIAIGWILHLPVQLLGMVMMELF